MNEEQIIRLELIKLGLASGIPESGLIGFATKLMPYIKSGNSGRLDDALSQASGQINPSRGSALVGTFPHAVGY